MDRVYKTINKPLTEIDLVAVGIFSSRTHIGLLHKVPVDGNEAVETVKLLHIGWYNDWGDSEEAAKQCTFWVALGLSPEQAILVSEMCKLVAKRNSERQLAFGIGGNPERIFDEHGDFIPDAAKKGITCAAFVLAIFHRSGFPLARYAEWPVRQDDTQDLRI
jgi:hypothetical protein